MKKYVNPYTISTIAIIISIMSYLDIGYNQWLTQENNISSQVQQLDSLQFDQFTQEISGSKIQGGKFQSVDGNYLIDLENNLNKVISGEIERILYGKLPDGTFGLIINDANGNEIGRLNENGLTIQQGKISIKGENNLEFINSKGIFSSNTFQLIKVYREQAQDVTDTSSPPIIELNGINLNFIIQQQALVIINLSFRSRNSLTGNTSSLQITINNTVEGPISTFIENQSSTLQSRNIYYPKIFNPGNHRVAVRARVSSGTGTYDNILLSALIFGL